MKPSWLVAVTTAPEHTLLGSVCSCGDWGAQCGHDIPEQWRQHANAAEAGKQGANFQWPQS